MATNIDQTVQKLTSQLSKARKEVFRLEMALSRARGKQALQNLRKGLRVVFVDLEARAHSER